MVDRYTKAAAYDDYMGRWSERLAPLFADFAQVRDDTRVLDVGCGTGVLAKLLSGTTRRLILVGIDLSQPFIDSCRLRFTDPRFSFDVGSAMDLPYPDASFDQALSLLMFHVIPEPEKAAREMRRVSRPGGTAAACTWATGEGGMEMTGTFWEEATKRNSAARNREERPRYCDRRGQLAELWRATGFEGVQEVTLEIQTEFRTFDDFWLPMTCGVGSPGVYLETQSQDERDALREALRARLLGNAADRPIMLRARGLAVRGIVPS